MQIHDVTFPNWNLDIVGECRTLFHLPEGPPVLTINAGDGLRLRVISRFIDAAAPFKVATVMDASLEGLLDTLDDDLARLACASRDEYLARWDARYPTHPSASNPRVWRIAFRYGPWASAPGDAPEWALAV